MVRRTHAPPHTAMDTEALLRRSIEVAVENVRLARGGPFGAVIARDGSIVAEGMNLVTSSLDPTAHAEVVAIRHACQALSRFDLRGCEVFASCEPCPMCLAACYWARVDRIWFAATKHDAAAAGFDDSLLYEEIPRAITERRIPTAQLLGDEGQAPFREWRRSPQRVDY